MKRAELMQAVMDDLIAGISSVFLTRDAEGATAGASRLMRELRDRNVEVRQSQHNPSYLRVKKSWVLFHPIADLSHTDQIGTPTYVYWPSEDLDYSRVLYVEWKRLRPQRLWCPLAKEEAPNEGPALSAYDLLDD